MRKRHYRLEKHYLGIIQKKRWAQLRAANQKRTHRTHPSRIDRLKETEKELQASATELKRTHRKKREEMFRRFSYNKPKKSINITESFGIEEEKNIDFFLKTAEDCIDFNSSVLFLNLDSCPRIWPSGIMLLCSLKQWVELSCANGRVKEPQIGSSDPKDSDVSNYLTYSGFYEYVNRPISKVETTIPHAEIVRIERERKRGKIYERADAIKSLMSRCAVNEQVIKWLDNAIIMEILINIIEHGVVNKDQGWWLLVQRHPTHKFISLCFADNGIGIKTHLLCGPQKRKVLMKLRESDGDGDFIKLACEEIISGASDAETGDQLRGSRRGNGLKRIRRQCMDMSIPLAIISHSGYIFYDSSGKIFRNGTSKNRLFAGTMYHLKVPTS